MSRQGCYLGIFQLPFRKPLPVFHAVVLLVLASVFAWCAVGEATGCLPFLWSARDWVGSSGPTDPYLGWLIAALGILGSIGWFGNSQGPDLVNSSIALVWYCRGTKGNRSYFQA